LARKHKAAGSKHCTKQDMTATASTKSKVLRKATAFPLWRTI